MRHYLKTGASGRRPAALCGPLGASGFTLTELMVAMTILSVGLLALAQMQIVSLQGTSSAARFSVATNLTRQTVESFKMPGAYRVSLSIVTSIGILNDVNFDNSDDADFAPTITKDTAIGSADLYNNINYDYIEVLQLDDATLMFDSICGPLAHPTAVCNTDLDNLSGGQYIRLVNVRNIPAGGDATSVMKEVNVIVLWKERTWTRSVNIRTLIGRKDYDFF